jgi:hypothetical protein
MSLKKQDSNEFNNKYVANEHQNPYCISNIILFQRTQKMYDGRVCRIITRFLHIALPPKSTCMTGLHKQLAFSFNPLREYAKMSDIVGKR